jgi:hypothetical protein
MPNAVCQKFFVERGAPQIRSTVGEIAGVYLHRVICLLSDDISRQLCNLEALKDVSAAKKCILSRLFMDRWMNPRMP